MPIRICLYQTSRIGAACGVCRGTCQHVASVCCLGNRIQNRVAVERKRSVHLHCTRSICFDKPPILHLYAVNVVPQFANHGISAVNSRNQPIKPTCICFVSVVGFQPQYVALIVNF